MNGSLVVARDRAIAGLPVLGRRRHDARDAILDLYEAAEGFREKLARAAFIAEHLMQMIDHETWRDSGGDDGQGHYEGDYRAAQTFEEIKSLKAAAE